MSDPERPHQPAEEEGEPEGLDAALRVAYHTDSHPSVLARIEHISGARSRVLLRDTPHEDSPVVRVPDRAAADVPTDDARYEILGEIARGGVGVIYKGRDKDLGRAVAMKVLRREHLEHEGVVARFVEEAQIGGQLQHPGIVPVHELGLRPDGLPFFAMRLVKGKTLSALLAQRARAEENRGLLLGIFERVCQTVAYAHARGVIHRDLKPANVMSGAFGEVQVVDWGFAKVLGQGGLTDERRASEAHAERSVIETVRTHGEGSASVGGSLMGTPAYMPPEQAAGKVDVLDERSDVFALGAILCEILTGLPPYVGPHTEVLRQALRADLSDALKRLDGSDADPTLIALARRCLAPERANRPRDAGEVAKEMAAYVAARDERARQAALGAAEARGRASEAEATARQERRARRLTLALAASAVLVLSLLGGGFYLGERALERRQ
ncbi:MAG: serine/threonine-protein kinase [Planctomycetota bacterium]|jgi:serine/threonine-protein kinase